MAATYINHSENCPFWSEISLKCRVCKGGLFIPLDNHIELYCKTPDYPLCLQYDVHKEKHFKIIDKKAVFPDNRRKFIRLEVHLQITLIKHALSEKVGTHSSTVVKTIDLSSGGMRLTTNNPLISKSVVQFSFGNAFPKSLQNFSGKVAWCNKEIDDPGYQAGISFNDEQVIEAMGQHLGLFQYEM